MKKTAIAFILLVIGYSCSESVNKSEAPAMGSSEAKSEKQAVLDTVAESVTEEDTVIGPYLEISSINEIWPSESSSFREINYQKDSMDQRYIRRYYPLDTLIQGRPVFAGTSSEQFFFYLPFNQCWILHSEFPETSVMYALEQTVGGNFREVVENQDYYRCGFEYGPEDTWDLQKLIFTKAPWNHSPNMRELSGPHHEAEVTTMYKLKWVGEDPMLKYKEVWQAERKAKLMEEWTAAYERYIANEIGSTAFVPKPIGTDYKGTLRSYFTDQYNIVEVRENEYEVKLLQDEFEMIKDDYGFTTVNEKGLRMISPEYAHGRTVEAVFESATDTLVFPWPSDMEEKYGSGISYHEDYQPFYSVIDGKMWGSGHYFSFPKADEKYLLVLLEFLYGDTYVLNENEGNMEYWERIYMMPSIDDMQRELGCIFSVTATRIDFFCDEGGC